MFLWCHQWSFSHLAESFSRIKAMTHALASHYDLWFECGTGLVNWTQESRPALQGPGLCRRHLCGVTGAPACQRFPGRELPSPMLTARQPDELSVSSNSPHSFHSAPPPGKNHCFTFHWALLLYSALDAYLSSFSFYTWQPRYLVRPLTEIILLNTVGVVGGYTAKVSSEEL